MKKFLPIFVSFVLVCSLFIKGSYVAHAQGGTTPQPTPDIPYSPDPEVNFVGKSAARSIQFLNWTLTNYYWQCDAFDPAKRACNNDDSPLIGFWVTIRNIVYAMFALFVLVTAFVLMTTRGRSLTVQRFLPRFVAVVLLVTFSYAILQLIYVATDIFQGFFLTKPPDASGVRKIISAEDLLYVGWDYETFQGLRKIHPFFDESVFVNLLLARLTAVTYYALTGILIIRKIILWFFIIVSPIFPVLLLYYPVRNTAKIWIGEFFRWLMYGPLFSVFLAGLVSMWKSGIPLLFNWSIRDSGYIVYPTATNILLGGPGQKVMINNNLNVPDTFAQYVVALIMLWVVMLLPFVLLQIFLDYLNSFSMNDSPAIQKIINTSYSLLNKQAPPPLLPGSPPPGSPGGAGMARALPIAKFGAAQKIPEIQDMGMAREIPIAAPVASSTISSNISSVTSSSTSLNTRIPINTQVLNAASISLPTMRDIVQYETAMLSQRESRESTVTKSFEALQKIASPEKITNTFERERITKIREQIVQQSQAGNPIAAAVLQASNIATSVSNVTNKNSIKNSTRLKNNLTKIASPTTATNTSVEKEKMTKLHDSLVRESQQGNTLATTLLSTTKETSLNQVQDLRERLVQQSMNNNSVATNVLATSMSKVETAKLQELVKELNNQSVSSTSSIDREKISQLKDTLLKESKEGNQLATTILNSKEITTSSQVEELKEKILDASLQGNQLATQILSTAITQNDTEIANQVLEQIATPETITNTIDKERFTQMREKLVQAQQQGNQVATNILTTINTIQQSQTTHLSKALQQINNPSSITSVVDKEKMTSIHDTLVKESQSGNQLATTLLSVNASTPATEVNNIKSQIFSEKAKGNPIATEVATLTRTPETTKDVQNLKAQLLEAKANGEPIATEVLNAITGQGANPVNAAIPQSNRVQSVSVEDYEAVKKMWQENYKNIEIPEGLTDRKEWISSEMQDIENIIGLLTSSDQQKVQEGMQEVSNILPFLMLGGFSQEEIVAYLKAKQEAGKTVLEAIVQDESDEDTMISVQKSHATASATMAQSQAIESASFSSSREDDDTEISSLQRINAQSITVNSELLQLTNLPMPSIKDVVKFEISLLSRDTTSKQEVVRVKETLQQLANPSLVTAAEDRQRIEQVRDRLIENRQQGDVLATTILSAASRISGTPVISLSQTSEQIEQVVNQLANPQVVQSDTVRQQITQLKEHLLQEQQSGNQTAGAILSAVNTIVESDVTNVKNVLSQINNPTSVSETEREQFTHIHDLILQESQAGNTLATNLLSTNEATSREDWQKIKETIKTEKASGNKVAAEVSTLLDKNAETKTSQELKQKILDAKAQGDPVATSLLSLATGEAEQEGVLPQTNRIQTVSIEDYEAIRQMWAESYKNLEVPTGVADRKDWISQEVQSIDGIVSLLSSQNAEDVQKGMEQVSNILPFLLLGGFSKEEIIAYLKAKEEAGKSVLQTIEEEQKDEDTMVTVNVQSTAAPAASAATVMPTVIETHDIIERVATQEVSDEEEKQQDNLAEVVKVSELIPLLQALHITVPSLRDVASYEKTLQSKEDERKESIIKVLQLLKYLSNPEELQDEENKEKLQELKRVLRKQRAKGDILAGVILKAMLNSQNKRIPFSDAQVMSLRGYLKNITKKPLEGIQGDNKQVGGLYEELVQQSQRGNQLTRRLFSFSKDVVIPEVRQMKEQLISELQEGNEVASVAVCAILLQMDDKPLEKYITAIINNGSDDRTFDHAKIQELRALLEKENSSGNQFASIVLGAQASDGESMQKAVAELVEQSKQGNKIAMQIVYAVFTVQDIEKVRIAIAKLISPQVPVSLTQKIDNELHEHFLKERSTDSILASRIAGITDTTPTQDLLDIQELIIAEARKGNVFATKILQQLPEDIQEMGDDVNTAALLPDINKVQTVSLEDYEAVRTIWEENYEKADLPTTETERKEWLEHERGMIEGLLADLTSGDEEKKKKSIQQVSLILPFLMLGGFSHEEVVAYVKAKLQAATSVLRRITADTENSEFVASTKNEEKPQVMAVSSDSALTQEQHA